MAHYALINENNIVTQVFVGKNENELLPAGFVSWEQYYCPAYAKACLRTSYNTIAGKHITGGQPFRKNYAGIGYIYDEKLDAFIPPKPYASWIFDEETCNWNAPSPQPSEEYIWSEESLAWVKLHN